MATIYEVARLAGVSPATVSRVFNGTSVSAEKAKLVRDAADHLAYTPNRAARTLRRRLSEVIALIIPDIENPFFTSLARGVEDAARAAGYSVVLCNSDEDVAKEAKYIDIAVLENMAGVIIAAASDDSDLHPLLSRSRPVVAVDRGPHGLDIDAVMVDNRAGGAAATAALVAHGFTRIGCITGPSDVETAQHRTDGWRDALRAGGLVVDERLLAPADYRVDGGRAAMQALLALPEPPDAVFVANNLMSVGALQALYSAGLTPESFGFAAFGDLPFAAFAPAGMTVVHVPARAMGRTAASMLLGRIAGEGGPPRTVVLRNELAQTPRRR
ncbi:LacI family DNA-binding transcriptional regulator [Agromyces badenianii]|uniref:LacI family DNA-binding transcriptional regulator n=1 Tax=Agromyces badenianii TaxID=2080742 RepID=UPI000D592B5E|nr:LacI family DNA-binding transcriptional regulator [Agromyces badenianii]PWC03224.1 LacI family transcriptional regulator [Agromyces badenianii]